MSAANLFDVFPTGILLFPALYAAVKIAAGVLVLHLRKPDVKRGMEEEHPGRRSFGDFFLSISTSILR